MQSPWHVSGGEGGALSSLCPFSGQPHKQGLSASSGGKEGLLCLGHQTGLPVLLASGEPARWLSTCSASCSLSLCRPSRKQLALCWAPLQPSGSSSVLVPLSKAQPSVRIGKQDSLSLSYQFVFWVEWEGRQWSRSWGWRTQPPPHRVSPSYVTWKFISTAAFPPLV